MARPRKNGLPANLNKNGAGYFYYSAPAAAGASFKSIGLGTDQQEAVRIAEELNHTLSSSIEERRRKRTASAVLQAKSGFTLDENGLLQLDYLRQNAERYDRVSGVYLLLHDGEVVYVGQSLDCHLRLASHFRDETKTFDSSYIVRADPRDLDDLEALYIRKYSPRLNISLPVPRRRTAWGMGQRIITIDTKL